jgi:hypothetical protein
MARRKRKATTRKKNTTTKTVKKENIRLTKKWKELYKNNKMFKGELMTVEQYKQLIDELYSGEKVDNKDLMGSFARFKSKK